MRAGQSVKRLGEAQGLPVGCATAEVLADVEPEGHRQFLFLHRGYVQVGGRFDASFRQIHHVVYGGHCAGAEHLSGGELGGNYGLGEILEYRLAVGVQAEKQVGHEHRHQHGQGAAEVGLHPLDIRVGRP